MKQRVLVMNGQRIVQSEAGVNVWKTDQVEKAGELKPGIYNIYTAATADKAKAYEGALVHADGQAVYQQVGKQFVRHARIDFEKPLKLGIPSSIAYDPTSGRALVSTVAPTPSRKMSR
jgi:cell filamentation protein